MRVHRRRGDGQVPPARRPSIYDTLVRLAQDFALRNPLVDGQGNFGSIDDDPAAAMRYTEARLERLATEMLRDIDADTVDFGPNYDETTKEPLVLPVALPEPARQRLDRDRGRDGDEHPAAQPARGDRRVQAYIENPDIDLAGLMEHVKGPDFPGGGIMSGSGIRDAYASGRGAIRVRARAHIEPLRGGKEAIIVSELPYMVKKGGDGGLITKIADLVREKKITEISDLRDESDRSGMRLVIELKRGGDPAGRAEQALQAHPDADLVRGQHGRARRRRAADALPEGADRATTSTTSARSSSAGPSTSCARPRPAPTCSRAS